MSNPSKRKGSSAEQAVADYLTEIGMQAERRVTAGANDKGDIAVHNTDICIEVKNVAQLSLGAWLKELQVETANAGATTGVLVVKRRGTTDPADWFAVMEFGKWLDLFERAES